MAYSKILDNLYLGNQYSTKIIKNVDVIISIGCNPKHIVSSKIETLKISIRDSITSDITPFLDLVCDTIHDRLQNGKKIIVHCKAGINRSTAFILAYLIKYNNMTLDNAKSHILQVRKVKFKENFVEQITNKYKHLPITI